MLLSSSYSSLKKQIGTFFLVLLSVIVFFKTIIPDNVSAQAYTPFPYPTPVPCDERRPEEFHSLRPYQASPCNDEATDLALFCGNDFILIDEIIIQKVYSPSVGVPPFTWEYRFEGQPITPSVEQPPTIGIACTRCDSNGQCVSNRNPPCIPYPDLGCNGPGDCTPAECVPNAAGTQETCTFIVDRVKDIVIDLDRTELPIMGYTEPSLGNTGDSYRVINSRLQDETVTDAQKVNEYVSWYLNGIIGRAEYDPPDTTTVAGRSRVVDFSGPLKRLLSWESQIVRRIQEVEKVESGDIRHDQIIGCHTLGAPTHCYPDSGVDILRLSYWATRLPPLRRAYTSWQAFWSAYQNWRANYNSKLFSYIPFSSTEDRKGEVEFGSYSLQPPLSSNVVILSSSILSQVPGNLFFPHMQEGFELANLFQRIYAPDQVPLNTEPEGDIITVSRDPFCDILEVRSNPGDVLFGTQASASIAYSAQVTCVFTIPGEGRLCRSLPGNVDCHGGVDYCNVNYGQVDCAGGEICGRGCGNLPANTLCTLYFSNNECYPTSAYRNCIGVIPGGNLFYCGDNNTVCAESCQQDHDPWDATETCTNQVPIALQVITKTPLANDIWKKLVAGPASVFRRLFPQIEDVEGRPIRRIWDIPAVTNAVYRSLQGDPVFAGTGSPGSQAEIYFPHIGGIHEYFLNCIQKTLRPQGFGQGCVSGPPPLGNITGEGSCAVPPPPPGPVVGSGDCEIPQTGFCSPGFLGQFFSGCHVNQAAIICARESGGNPSAINCGCLLGTSVDYSVGLFQINLLAHRIPGPPAVQCSDAFQYSCPYSWCENQGPISCSVLDQGIADQCAAYFFDPAHNAAYAAQISLGGTNWTPWAAYTVTCRGAVDAQCP